MESIGKDDQISGHAGQEAAALPETSNEVVEQVGEAEGVSDDATET
jgi:hypothetical protein